MATKRPQKIHPRDQYRSKAHIPRAIRSPNVELPPGVTVDKKGRAHVAEPEADGVGEAVAVKPTVKKKRKRKAGKFEAPLTFGGIDK